MQSNWTKGFEEIMLEHALPTVLIIVGVQLWTYYELRVASQLQVPSGELPLLLVMTAIIMMSASAALDLTLARCR